MYQEISCPLCTLKVHHCMHNFPPRVPISSYMNPANTLSLYFLRSILLSPSLYLCLSSACFSSEFETSVPPHLLSLLHAYSSLLPWFDNPNSIWQTHYELLTTFFSSFLLSPPSCSNIHLHTLVSYRANVCSFLNVQDKYSYSHIITGKIIVQMKTNNCCQDELSGWDNAQKTEPTITYSVVEPTVYSLNHFLIFPNLYQFMKTVFRCVTC
jgi:hypothetical protein